MMYMPVLVNVPSAVQQFPACSHEESPQNAFSASREELEAQAADLEREAAELKRRAKQAMEEAAAMTKTSPTSPINQASEPGFWVMQQAIQCQTSQCAVPAVSSQAMPYHAVCQPVPCQTMAYQQSAPQPGTMVACFVAPSQDMSMTQSGAWDILASRATEGKKLVHNAEEGHEARTTLMLRNLPNDYTRDMTIDILNKKGFAGQYDFFYMPVDFNSNAGLGYAFANAISHEAALDIWKALQDFDDWVIPSHKVLDVSWSELSQGLEAHIERYRNSPVMHPDVRQEFKPVLFHQGVLREFPAATKQIHAPRLKKLHQGLRKSMDSQVASSQLQAVERSPGLSPWERIKKTIRMINSGDISRLCAHARDSLSSSVVLCCPQMGEFRSISQVCDFHHRLHEAIPDMKLSLENIEQKMGAEKKIIWRVTCSGTQVKPLLPFLSIGAERKFTLEVTVLQNSTGKPRWLEWSFGLVKQEGDGAENDVPQVCKEQVSQAVSEEIDEKRLKHLRGECQPCAYFAFRSDGCRRGDDCEFCHLCTKTQARAKKKAKALRVTREAKAAEGSCPIQTSDESDPTQTSEESDTN